MQQVNPARFMDMLQRLATFGAVPGGGVAREALTISELEARRWLCSRFSAPHYRWYMDDAANLFLRRAGLADALTPVMTGSHIDTQPVGGWLDGAYGVVAGMELFLALDDAGIRTQRPLELVIWTNEEGSRFSPGAMGSSAFADPTRLADFLPVTDAGGERFEQARDAARQATPAATSRALGRPVHAYLEAHIEQGPVLEDGGFQLGIVTGIQGVRWFEISVTGVSAHAGTTPLAARHDALMSAAQLISRLGEMAAARQDPALRFTVGRLEVSPGSINTIADRVTFTIDLRHPEEAVLAEMEALIRQTVEAKTGACGYALRSLMRRPPTRFDKAVIETVAAAVSATGAPACRLGSGAFHDAMYLADVCPTAMLFVPSHKGISHNPAEDTAEADLVAGVRALAGAVITLATPANALQSTPN
ncbi:hypothetical protein AAY24_06955 [Sedimenticola thiotaurini]|uniref:Peptidase M20 dimerisation domain-containing protein n=2 Tax=Sedimenticola thiotaurini TaxID=1543721 RepID=A0A0F7JY02_9GAMM|nr:hypothetical protein AAY24_06955 [Sedimenticola thiotaurini]